MSVYDTFENGQIKKAQDVVASYTAVAKALKDETLAKKLNLEPHCRAKPSKKAILRGYSLIPKVDIATYQEQNREHWKKVNFVAGKGVKEGKRKYNINNILDPKTKSIFENTKRNKDAFKAAIMWCVAPDGMMTEDERKREYASSKGFHECILGTVSKKYGLTTGDLEVLGGPGDATIPRQSAGKEMMQNLSG